MRIGCLHLEICEKLEMLLTGTFTEVSCSQLPKMLAQNGSGIYKTKPWINNFFTNNFTLFEFFLRTIYIILYNSNNTLFYIKFILYIYTHTHTDNVTP